MTGSISLYDKEGERLYSIYLGGNRVRISDGAEKIEWH